MTVHCSRLVHHPFDIPGAEPRIVHDTSRSFTRKRVRQILETRIEEKEETRQQRDHCFGSILMSFRNSTFDSSSLEPVGKPLALKMSEMMSDRCCELILSGLSGGIETRMRS